MSVDPTQSGRAKDNFASLRKSVGKLGELSGVSRTLKATATLDYGSISSGACAEKTVTVTGAKTGDSVSLGPPSGIEAGLTWSGYVSASDTVTIRVCNPTGSPIDPASAAWLVRVVGF